MRHPPPASSIPTRSLVSLDPPVWWAGSSVPVDAEMPFYGQMLELEADHRRHAIVEQSIAELKSAGLAHLPSGHFMANAAWARPRGRGPQPRPRRRPARRTRPRPGDHRDPAPHGLHRSRSARAHRPPTTPATTRSMALGRCDQHRPRRNDRAPAPQLNITLIPTTGPGEAGRPAAPARPTHIRRRRRPPNLSTAPPTRSTVDPCARKRRPQATPEFSAPGSTPTTGCSDKSLSRARRHRPYNPGLKIELTPRGAVRSF
jgi:hypothetical protein